jgi:shikimate dehydrogenase/3-dehydroquinate dehydratase type I
VVVFSLFAFRLILLCYSAPVEYIASLTPAAGVGPLEAVQNPPDGASLVEVRADLFGDLDLGEIVSASPLPVLVTLRSAAEGGRGPVDPGRREVALRRAHEAGAAVIDLEFNRDLPLLTSLGLSPEQVVLSWHHPTETPTDLARVADSMLATPARLVKVVPTACRLADLEKTLRLYTAASRRSHRLMAYAMGTVGIASRYLAPLLGAPVAFAAWTGSAPAAPGQLTVSQLERVIGHLQGPPQRLYGVVGGDVSTSLSPTLHAAGYGKEQLPFLFLPVSVPSEEDLGELFAPQGSTLFDRVGLMAAGWAVTAPHKRAAARAATLAAPRVRRAGAANTLILRPQQVVAENTDADGVVGSLRSRGIDPSGRRALVQGTGGAARGAAVGLDLAGATVSLRGRDSERTRSVADEIGVDWCAADQTPDGAELLLNATPLGTGADDPNPFSPGEVNEAKVVLDMLYADHPTRLAERAAAAGVPLIDGREMLLHQGYAQFAAFTGRLPPKDAMRAALMVDPK